MCTSFRSITHLRKERTVMIKHTHSHKHRKTVHFLSPFLSTCLSRGEFMRGLTMQMLATYRNQAVPRQDTACRWQSILPCVCHCYPTPTPPSPQPPLSKLAPIIHVIDTPMHLRYMNWTEFAQQCRWDSTSHKDNVDTSSHSVTCPNEFYITSHLLCAEHEVFITYKVIQKQAKTSNLFSPWKQVNLYFHTYSNLLW